jgi:hypothetical protein
VTVCGQECAGLFPDEESVGTSPVCLPKKVKPMETMKTVIIVSGCDVNLRFDEMVLETCVFAGVVLMKLPHSWDATSCRLTCR